MYMTNDMYRALAKLQRWYNKYEHQVIEISGTEGTGIMEVIKSFISTIELDPREIMWLSFDQKQVLEMAYKRYHTFHIYNRIYNYIREISFDSLPIINPNSSEIEYTWKKKIRKKIGDDYKLIIILDSLLINKELMEDVCTYGLPIILVRDPMLIPAADSYTCTRDPNISLHELNPDLLRSPILYFANKALRGESVNYGNYDSVSIIPKKQLNLYNMKSAEMILTVSDTVADSINKTYREKVLKVNPAFNYINERLIISEDLHGRKLVNEDEKNVKVFLAKGTVGYISKCNKHAAITKYIPISFRPEFYHESFEELYLDRNSLNGVETPSRQLRPDEVFKCEYAYALSATKSRFSHWDKVTLIADKNPEIDNEMYKRMLYTAITRSHGSLTLLL